MRKTKGPIYCILARDIYKVAFVGFTCARFCAPERHRCGNVDMFQKSATKSVNSCDALPRDSIVSACSNHQGKCCIAKCRRTNEGTNSAFDAQ